MEGLRGPFTCIVQSSTLVKGAPASWNMLGFETSTETLGFKELSVRREHIELPNQALSLGSHLGAEGAAGLSVLRLYGFAL